MGGIKAVERLTENARRVNSRMNFFVADLIADGETMAFIIDAKAEEQLYEQGINRLGVDISDYAPYSPLTIEIKQAKGQPFDRVTLRDEGDFESSFFLDIGEDRFEIKAADFKTEGLIQKYGRQILGLTVENLTILIWEYVYPGVMDKVKKQLYER